MTVRRSAITGALVGALVGDCVGAPYEGSGPVDLAGARRRIEHALDATPLRYTDDTQLTMALAEHLVDDDAHVDGAAFVARILGRFERRRGYGAGMVQLVDLWRDGTPIDRARTAVFSDGSFGNGAAMRVAPVGVRWAGDPAMLDAAAARSAAVTHAHPVGIDGAVVQARAIAAAATAGAFTVRTLEALDASTAPLARGLVAAAALGSGTSPRRVARRLGSDVTAHRSLPAALWCAATAGDIAEAITRALAVGGDTDTIASMAAAIRGAADGPGGIPASWLAAVEGHDEMAALATRLADASGATSGAAGEQPA